MRQFRHRFKKSIVKVKDYLMNLPLFYEDSLEGIIEAIQTGEISDAKAHIYINFLHEIIVVNKDNSTKYIEKYKEEFKEVLSKLGTSEIVRIDEVAVNQIVEAGCNL